MGLLGERSPLIEGGVATDVELEAFAQMGHGLLNDAPATAHAADRSPTTLSADFSAPITGLAG